MTGPNLRELLKPESLKELSRLLGDDWGSWICYMDAISSCSYTKALQKLPENFSYEEAFHNYNYAFDYVNDLWGLPEKSCLGILCHGRCHMLDAGSPLRKLEKPATSSTRGEPRLMALTTNSRNVVGKDVERCLRTGLNPITVNVWRV